MMEVKSDAARTILHRNLKCFRSTNQCKLEVVKQEMARVNIDILGISELNGLEWANLTQMTIISTTVGKNPLEEMGVALIGNKSLKCSSWVQSQK